MSLTQNETIKVSFQVFALVSLVKKHRNDHSSPLSPLLNLTLEYMYLLYYGTGPVNQHPVECLHFFPEIFEETHISKHPTGY